MMLVAISTFLKAGNNILKLL